MNDYPGFSVCNKLIRHLKLYIGNPNSSVALQTQLVFIFTIAERFDAFYPVQAQHKILKIKLKYQGMGKLSWCKLVFCIKLFPTPAVSSIYISIPSYIQYILYQDFHLNIQLEFLSIKLHRQSIYLPAYSFVRSKTWCTDKRIFRKYFFMW